jgi:hypothetical protein
MNHHIKRIWKRLRPDLKNVLRIIAAVLIVYVLVQCLGCQKESSFTSKHEKVIESDHHLKPATGYNLTKRTRPTKPGNGHGKPPKDTTVVDPPQDTTNPEEPQPPVSTGKVIFLDFDGHYIVGSYWNTSGPIDAKPSGMTVEEQAATVARVRADYSEFPVTVTDDSTVYFAADPLKRMRVIITESWEWYTQAGGVAYVGSFTWGNETPCFVFSSLLGYGSKVVADAASHEAGHTLGLRHQSACSGGVKTQEYNSGIAPDGKGYLMGYPYDKISGWQIGTNSVCSPQDDRLIINNTLR